jgi:acyl carrier protein
MGRMDIIEKINGFLADEFEIDKESISPQSNLRDALQLDSLDYIDLVVVVESNFGFKIKQDDFISITTFQDFYDYVIARVNEKTAA